MRNDSYYKRVKEAAHKQGFDKLKVLMADWEEGHLIHYLDDSINDILSTLGFTESHHIQWKNRPIWIYADSGWYTLIPFQPPKVKVTVEYEE